jgi:hypothetical protein
MQASPCVCGRAVCSDLALRLKLEFKTKVLQIAEASQHFLARTAIAPMFLVWLRFDDLHACRLTTQTEHSKYRNTIITIFELSYASTSTDLTFHLFNQIVAGFPKPCDCSNILVA